MAKTPSKNNTVYRPDHSYDGINTYEPFAFWLHLTLQYGLDLKTAKELSLGQRKYSFDESRNLVVTPRLGRRK